MYKKIDQVGDQQEGLNMNCALHIIESTALVRRALSGILLSSAVAIIGIERDNDALVGTGMFMAYITTFQLIDQMRKLRQNAMLDEFPE